jgi:hypothetical protein
MPELIYGIVRIYTVNMPELSVADAMDRVQQACQEEWKMCRKEK